MTAEIPAEKETESDSQDAILAYNSAGQIRRQVFPAQTVLFRKGEIRQCAYLIDKGEVHITGSDEGGEDKLLCVLGEGEIFGEMALVDAGKRTATAITSSDAEIFVIPRGSLQERLKGMDPILGLLIGLLLERYRMARFTAPESVRQDSRADPFKKASPYDRLPKGVLQRRNLTEQRDNARREMQLEQDLRAGLEKNQFVPVLQPILSLRERRIVGFEALVRWAHPEKGLIMPDDFIPIAERTGVIQRIDRMMMEKACELLPSLQKQAGGAKDLFISVNLSGLNFGTAEVVKTVEQVLRQSKVNPAHIHLEITESALIGDAELAEQVLRGLKDIGVLVSLDDFGTGYSSLGYLHKFTIDTLKIDRSFVSQLQDGRRSIDLIRAIVALAHSFDLGIIAEGIEKEEDVIALNGLGCDMGQGYLFSRPLSIDDARAFIIRNLGIPESRNL
jgi:diguanylate cyclase